MKYAMMSFRYSLKEQAFMDIERKEYIYIYIYIIVSPSSQ